MISSGNVPDDHIPRVKVILSRYAIPFMAIGFFRDFFRGFPISRAEILAVQKIPALRDDEKGYSDDVEVMDLNLLQKLGY